MRTLRETSSHSTSGTAGSSLDDQSLFLPASCPVDDGDHLFPDPRRRTRSSFRRGTRVPGLAALFRILDSTFVRSRSAAAIRSVALQSHIDVDGVPEPPAR